MNELIEQLVKELQNELKEYGEMLALLEEQQEHLMSRRVDGVMDTVVRINEQTLVLKRAREPRELTQRQLARATGQPESSGMLALVQFLPETYAPLLQALVEENQQLLSRAQQRGRQNYLILTRAMELMRQCIGTMTPGFKPVTYGGNGVVQLSHSYPLSYEAKG